MLRNIAVLMSALVAMSAQAQDASKPKEAEKSAPIAPSTEGEQSPVVLAPRGPPVKSDHPLPPPSAPPAKPKPDAGVDASAREEPNDCGMEQALLDQEDMPVGVRFYDAAPTKLERQQHKTWDSLPKVTTAGRCLRKYVIQVMSESEKPWPLKDATLVGSDGKVLKVIRIRPGKATPNISINIITAVKTEGDAGPDYMLSTIVLMGEDGQAVVLQDVKLP